MSEPFDPVDAPIVARRRQIPSLRSQQLGAVTADTDADAGDMSTNGPGPERPVLQARRFDLSALNPFGVAAGAGAAPLLILAFVSFVGGGDQQAIFSLIPQMRASLGYDLQFLLVFSTAVTVVTALVAPLLGHLADRVKRVWMMRIGIQVMHLSAVGIGLAAAPLAIIGSRSLTGLGSTAVSAAQNPLLADYYPPEKRGRAFAFLLQAGSLGGLLTPIVVGVVAQLWGWRAAFIGIGGAASIAGLLYFFLREPKRGEMDRVALGMDPKSLLPENPPRLTESLRAIRSIGTMRRLWYASVFLSAGGFGGLTLITFYADFWHLGPIGIGLITSARAFGGLLGQFASGPIVDRMLRDRPGRVMYFVGAMGLTTASFLVLTAIAPWLWLSIICVMVFSAASLMIAPEFSPPITALTAVAIPARIRGFGMATLRPFSLVGLALVFGGIGVAKTQGASLQTQIVAYAPMFVIAALILASAAFGVERDIRAAMAASVAEEEALRAKLAGERKLLVCRDVDVTYDGAQVLFGVDFDVSEGEIVALLGTNGSGKSTLLRAIAGLQEASNGAIVMDGVDVTHSPAHLNAARGVVMVPGGRAIFPTMSVAENLRAAERLAPGDGDERAARLNEVFALFPILRTRLKQKAGDLSGGEQQMLSLGQAFLLKPRLLMVDELSLGLAPQVVEVLLEALRRIHSDGATIVLVEQSVNIALTIAHRAVFMEKGLVTFEGNTRDLMGRGDIMHSTFLGKTQGSNLASPSRRRQGPVVEEAGPILVVEGLGVRYGGVQALSDISLAIRDGEVVGFIGPNGAGKTTLFDVISGFTAPSTGSVRFLDVDVTAASPDQRARDGLVRSFQNVRLFAALTVRENIGVAFERHLKNRSAVLSALYFPMRASERRIRRRTDVLLDTLGLRPFADKFVNELSTGSRRIVDLACLLAAEPRLLLLDEPSSGLAQAETEELGPLIGRIARETGCSILVVEHDVPLVAAVSDRLVAMEEGRLIAVGTPEAVMADPRVIRAYLGTSDDVLARSGALAGAGSR